MKQRLQLAGAISGVVGLICMGILMMTQGSSSATGTFSTTRANAGYARMHAYDHSGLKATVATYSRVGKMTSRHVFHSRAAALKFAKAQRTTAARKDSGTTPSPTGCFGNQKVTITMSGYSTLGHRLFHDWVWINWGWDCLAHNVNVLDHGKNKHVDDGVWSWDKWTDSAANYYNWDGTPHSGYNQMGEGEFHGPCINPATTCHRYPRAQLKARSNGSNWWSATE